MKEVARGAARLRVGGRFRAPRLTFSVLSTLRFFKSKGQLDDGKLFEVAFISLSDETHEPMAREVEVFLLPAD